MASPSADSNGAVLRRACWIFVARCAAALAMPLADLAERLSRLSLWAAHHAYQLRRQ